VTGGGQPRAAVPLAPEEGSVYRFRPAFPPPPAPLFQAEQVEAREPPASVEHYDGQGGAFAVRFPPGEWRKQIVAHFGRAAHWSCLVRRDGSKMLLQDAQPLAAPLQAFQAVPESAAKETTARALGSASREEARARQEVLDFALERGGRARGRDLLAFFGPPAEQAAASAPLVRIEGVNQERGPRFSVWLFEVDVVKK
jgi:hypothetical protein